MRDWNRLFIDGEWIEPSSGNILQVTNPANGELIGRVPAADLQDVDLAVAAAQAAFPGWSAVSVETRVDYLQVLVNLLSEHSEELAQIITAELGAPINLSRNVHVGLGIGVFSDYIALGKALAKESIEVIGNSEIYHEPIGVCALITPWNYPLHQIVAKLAPALVAGCTVVLKPSSETPLTAYYVAELIEKSGLPDGVFNLVSGSGRVVGEALCTHPDIDMVSITGSTSAGARVAELAAPTIKRVSQELGGKSACIVLDDAPLDAAVPCVVMALMSNTGQTCAALTRLLVPRALHDEAVALAVAAANTVTWGDPLDDINFMGPQVSTQQRDTVVNYIKKGIAEQAQLVCGGLSVPDELKKGAYVAPTIFANVSNDMTIAREEIFGPVLTIIPYDDEEQALQIANDNDYGLSGAVWSARKERAKQVALKMQTGQVFINDGGFNMSAPFGGYKKSGNGRELGKYGLEEYLETKALNV